MPLSVDQTLQNRYRIDALLGQGGMGAVYRAWDTRLQIAVAVKENLDASLLAQKQFEREAQMLARLSHPNLPRVSDFFFLPEQGQYLVMDFVEGEDLGQMIGRLGRLPEPEVLNWISQICDALAYLHSQPSPVIHRDIKPANIKVRPDGRAMLVDFGIAKIYDANLATTMGAKAITPGYSPLEQYGAGSTDARSDIYALGATLYHLLTGRIPPESIERAAGNVTLPPPRKLNGQISTTTEQAILRAVEVTTDRRFQSVAELVAALSGTPSRGAAPVAGPATGRRSGWPVLLLAAVLVVVALFIVAQLIPGAFGRPEPTATPPVADAITRPPTGTATRLTATATVAATAAPSIQPTSRPSPTPLPAATDSPAGTEVLEIASTAIWFSTGIRVDEGDTVTITYLSGRWRSEPGGDWLDALHCTGTPCPDCLLPTAPEGCLIARVGLGSAFCVGRAPFVASYNGRLQLAFNDYLGSFGDNEGSVTVRVEIAKP